MDVRHLRYAVTLADTLHFGRAAERMFITQSAFSQHIAKLERDLDAKLFERGGNRVAITPAGIAFVERAEQLLADVEATRHDVRQIADGASGVLVVGVFAEGLSEIMPVLFSAYSAANPDVALRFVELDMINQVTALRDGIVDVAFLRPPIVETEIDLDLLYAEPRVLLVGADHRLADADSLPMSELVDEVFATAPPPAAARWVSFWACDDSRGGPTRTARVVSSMLEMLSAVAYLGAVDTAPISGRRCYPYPGVRFVPLENAAYSSVGVARRVSDDRPLVQNFCRITREVVDRHLALIPEAVPLEAAPPGTPLALA